MAKTYFLSKKFVNFIFTCLIISASLKYLLKHFFLSWVSFTPWCGTSLCNSLIIYKFLLKWDMQRSFRKKLIYYLLFDYLFILIFLRFVFGFFVSFWRKRRVQGVNCILSGVSNNWTVSIPIMCVSYHIGHTFVECPCSRLVKSTKAEL